MSNQANSRVERFFVQAETVYGEAPNTAGEATVSGTDAVMMTSFNVQNNTQLIPRRDKTGSRGLAPGVRGRSTASWNLTATLAPGAVNGSPVAGTPPPLNRILEAIHGKDVDSSGGRISYKLADVIKNLTAYSYRDPDTMSQRCLTGMVVSSANIGVGGSDLVLQCNGEAKYAIHSDRFTDLNTQEKSGLTVFPVQPATPDYTDDGGLVLAFTGMIQLSGVTLPNIRNVNISYNTGNMTRKDTFGTFVSDGTEGATRSVAASFAMYDEDTPEVSAIRAAAEDKIPQDAIITVGTNLGARFRWTLKGLQLSDTALDDGSIRWSLNVPQSLPGSESTPGAMDEIMLEIL